jgi:hypothetical protein
MGVVDVPATLALVDQLSPPEELANLVVTLRSHSSTHVGSGGALAVARFASTLCTEMAGRSSIAFTPMAFCETAVSVVFGRSSKEGPWGSSSMYPCEEGKPPCP